VNQYRGWDPNLAVQDYYSRIRDHENHYETVDELDVPSIRIMNVCSQGSLYGMSP
jgi:6-phosphofructo-2-kinase/fructose-2,6-biphosphatase 4